MFGHQDDQNNQAHDVGVPDQVIDTVLAEPAAAPVAATDPSQPSPAPSVDPSTPADGGDTPVYTDDLLEIKQEALSKLQPLVGHLDQSAEEKFRTTMMMIQATDDQSLIKTAYDAAQAITDEKAKAQALLDVINEINYFTHHHEA